jgi:uncharacterized protein YjbJ (UPF0337 family)
MGEFIDKAKGAVNEAIGKTKSAAGTNNNDPDLKAEGDAQTLKGDAQQLKGDIKGKFGNKL